MWMFGAISKEELKNTKGQGWKFERELTPDEVDKFVSPDETRGCAIKTDKIFALFYVDSDMAECLNSWYYD